MLRRTCLLWALQKPPHFLHTPEYHSARSRLSLLHNEDLMRELHTVSKITVSDEHRPLLHALISEVTESRARQVSWKMLRDLCTTAYVSGLHEECVQLFLRRWEATTKSDSAFVPFSSVIDAAYRCGRVDLLGRFAELCAQRMASFDYEVISDFSLCRILWRLCCAATIAETPMIAKSGESLEKVRLRRTQEADEALVQVWSQCYAKAYPTGFQRVSDHVGLLRRMKRLVLYSHQGNGNLDEGESAFFNFCRRQRLLRSTEQVGTARKHQKENDESHYLQLILTCKAGAHVPLAMAYFDEYRSLRVDRTRTSSGSGDADSGDHASKQKWLLVEEEEGAAVEQQGGGAGSTAEKLAAGDQPTGSSDGASTKNDDGGAASPEEEGRGGSSVEMSETLIVTLFGVLQQAKAFTQLLQVALEVLDATNGAVSVAVWSHALIAAGEERNLSCAQRGYDHAVERLRKQDYPPGARDSHRYLLQTSLHALAKCHHAQLEELYITPCLEEGLLPDLSDETLWYLRAQNGLHSSDPAASALSVWSAMKQQQISVSPRLGTQLLKAFLRAESPSFWELYQELVAKHPPRALWIDELLLWADRRRSHLTVADKRAIVSEVERYYGVMDEQGKLTPTTTTTLGKHPLQGAKMTEGLRAMLSLLKHDVFLLGAITGEEGGPKSSLRGGSEGRLAQLKKLPGPALLDPRVHFLTKKGMVIDRGAYRAENDVQCGPAAWRQRIPVDLDRWVLPTAVVPSSSSSPSTTMMDSDDFRLFLLTILTDMQRGEDGVMPSV